MKNWKVCQEIELNGFVKTEGFVSGGIGRA